MESGSFQSTIKDLHAVLDGHGEEIRRSSSEYSDQLQKARGALEALLGSATAAFSQGDRLLSELRTPLTALEELLTRETGDSEQTRKRLEELESSLEEKRRATSALETRVGDLERQLGDEKAVTAATHARIAELDKELLSVQAQLQQAEQQSKRFEEELSSQAQQSQGNQNEVTQLAERNAALEEELASLRGQIGELEKAREQSTAELAAAMRDADSLRGRVMEGAAAQEHYETSLKEAKSEYAEALVHAQSEAEALRVALEQLQAKTSSSPTADEWSALREQLSSERDRADMAEQRLRDETSKGTKSVLAQQLAEALRETEETREELCIVRQELEHLRREKPSVCVISDEQRVIEAASRLHNGQKRALGELLLEAGLLTQEQLEQSLEEQKKSTARHLGEILITRKFASDVAVAQAMACQCEVDFVHLTPESVSAEAATLISERLANQHTCIPIGAAEDSLILAIVNPMDLLAIEDVERATNRKVVVVVATAKDIKEAISRFYWEPE